MSKVNFGSKLEYEHEKNFKILQVSSFHRLSTFILSKTNS